MSSSDDQAAHDRYLRAMGIHMLRMAPRYDWPPVNTKGYNSTSGDKRKAARTQRKKMKRHHKRGKQ